MIDYTWMQAPIRNRKAISDIHLDWGEIFKHATLLASQPRSDKCIYMIIH